MSISSYAWQSTESDFKLSYSFLAENELWTLLNCQPYTDSWLTSLLALARVAPQLLTFALYIAGFWHKELYLLVFGIGMSVSTLINLGVNALIDAEPRVATCMPVHGAGVSFETQQIAFFTTFALGYVALYEAPARIWHLLLLISVFALVFYGDHVLNYHTAEAIVSAAVIGSLLAFCYQWLLYMFVVPTFPYVLRSRYVAWFGYEDTLCHTVVLSALGRHILAGFDRQFGTSKLVAPEAVCALVRERIQDYLTRKHAVFAAADIAHIEPLLSCQLSKDTNRPLATASARQFIEDFF